MTYICNDCLQVFDDPAMVDDSFDHAHGTERRYLATCPFCGSVDIFIGSTCRNAHCHNARRRGDILCTECRQELHKRLCTFFDTLTAEEEEQVDAWLDGKSITDRKNWEVQL